MRLVRREIRVLKLLLQFAEEQRWDTFLDDIRAFRELRDRVNDRRKTIKKEKRKRAKYKNSRVKTLRKKLQYG